MSGHGALRAHQDAHTRALGQLGTRTELDNQSFLNWSENDIIIRQSCGQGDSGHSVQTAQLMAALTSYQAVETQSRPIIGSAFRLMVGADCLHYCGPICVQMKTLELENNHLRQLRFQI